MLANSYKLDSRNDNEARFDTRRVSGGSWSREKVYILSVMRQHESLTERSGLLPFVLVALTLVFIRI